MTHLSFQDMFRLFVLSPISLTILWEAQSLSPYMVSVSRSCSDCLYCVCRLFDASVSCLRLTEAAVKMLGSVRIVLTGRPWLTTRLTRTPGSLAHNSSYSLQSERKFCELESIICIQQIPSMLRT